MLFHVYGGNGIYQWIAMLAVLAGLILLNEFARRTKFGGLMMFGIIPLALTVYFVVIAVCAGQGVEWAVNNQTHLYMNGWLGQFTRNYTQTTKRGLLTTNKG